MNPLKLPIGVSDFRAIRTEGYRYVDKTAHIGRLIDEGRRYFLSRPRRFGKTLLLSTMQCLFEGREELFEGLAIHGRRDWSQTHPVVRLSFNGEYGEPGKLAASTNNKLAEIERTFSIPPEIHAPQAQDQLENILAHLHRSTGRQAVVLVDEYDKPILDALGDPELAKANRRYLRGIFGAIKGAEDHLRFVFFTGITMFSRTTLFSTLNVLNNISISSRYSDICGYTENDLDTVFADALEGLDREEIRRWYNGYSWRGKERVYNPYDILYLLNEREYRPYWFVEGGRVSFLYQVLLERQFTPLDLESLTVKDDFVSTFDIGEISAEALLFQTGFLTITGEHWDGDFITYDLDYPNREVRLNLTQEYLQQLFGSDRKAPEKSQRLLGLLLAHDFDGFAEALCAMLAAIPYQWHGAGEMARREGWYASVLQVCLHQAGAQVRGEESSYRGRSDLVAISGDQVFVFELKMLPEGGDADRTAAEAIRQIRQRGYADKYLDGTKRTHLIGAAFSGESRNLEAIKIADSNDIADT